MKLPEITPIIFSNQKNDASQQKNIPANKPSPVISQKYKDTSAHDPYGVIPKKTEYWDITDLENFFKNTPLPSPPVKLNPWTTIIDIALFIDSHLAIVKANNGIHNYKPHFNRLLEFKNYLLFPLN
jgi:hypothetical protein